MFGIKEKEYMIKLFQKEKDLKNIVYNILILLFDINKENINNKSIIYKLDNLKKKLVEELKLFDAFLIELNEYNNSNNNIIYNNNNYKELYKFNEKNKKATKSELFSREILQRSNLVDIMIKEYFNINDLIIRKLVMSDRFRNSLLKTPQQIKNEKKNNKSVIESILNNLNKYEFKFEMKYKYKISNTLQIYDNLNIEFLTKKNNQYIIYLKFPIFTISLQLPFNENCNINNFFYEIKIIGKDEYENTSFFEEMEPDKKNNKILLYEKIKSLFEKRIISLLQIYYEEKKIFNPNIKNNNNNLIFTNEYIIEILLRFIDYVYDYSQLFKIECDICKKKIKYNSIEKCFFPPYYKLLINKENLLSNKINNNEKILNLFVHEECFKRNSLREI